MNIYSQGVINITPDSFSNQSQFSNSQNVLNEIHSQAGFAHIIDIGAESTAPFNKAISIEEEISRYEKFFFPILKEIPSHLAISIDSYKPEVFEACYQKIRSFDKERTLIFNDVSGKLDLDLKSYFQDTNFKYIFSHNLAPSRDQTQEHMEFLTEDIFHSLKENFDECLDRYGEYSKQLILDPCFGFSKTKEQNFEIIQHLTELIMSYHQVGFLVGVSRKSFTRLSQINKDVKTVEGARESDMVQCVIVSQLLSQLISQGYDGELIFRLHRPSDLALISSSLSIFFKIQ